MNARQKAKYYKRKYEYIKSMMKSPVQIYRPAVNINTLKACEIVPRGMEQNEEFLDHVKNHMAEKMAEQMKDFVEYRVTEDPIFFGHKIEAILSVVRM